MDLQNVKNITIPEGSVNNIHDQNGKLLWGRLAYDTKYAGDTLQNGTPTPDTPASIQVVTGEQTVWVHGENLFDRENALENKILVWTNGNEYNESGSLVGPYMDVNEGDKFISNYSMFIFFYDSSSTYLGTLHGDGTIKKASPAAEYNPTAFTVPSGYSIAKMRIEYRKNRGINTEDMVAVDDIMLNSGTTLFPYSPYQGQSYTVDLGSAELCKIGDYQDYIYKSGDDWYVHKEVGKVVADGDTNITLHGTSGGILGARLPISEDAQRSGNDISPIKCDYFQSVKFDTYYNDRSYGEIASHNTTVVSYLYITSPDSSVTTIEQFKSWLATHTTTAYYALATSTDTQITDNTLITQLNAIHKWLTRHGYLSNVTGNLPLLINQTNL